MFAVFHSLDRVLPLSINLADQIDIKAMQHPASRLLFKGTMEREENTRLPKVYINPVTCIVSPAIVIRDINPTWDGRSSKIILHRSVKEEVLLEYIIVRRRRQWSDVFQKVCQNTYGGKKRFVPDFTPHFKSKTGDEML
jgi:hypothetical protein